MSADIQDSVAVRVRLKVLPRSKVLVRNYRFRPPRREEGTCTSVEAHWTSFHGEKVKAKLYSLQYAVLLSRKSATGNPIRLYVSPEDIEAMR